MKTNIKALAVAGLTLLMTIAGSSAAYAKMNKALGDTASTGMNALDHVLQRPLGNSSFEHKRFGDHFFINAGGGVSVYDQKPSGGFRPGLSGEVSFGDWVTPVHGWRVNIGGGTHSKHAGEPWKAYASLSADYLMNFSALLKGYNPDRRVEIIGALGAEYQRMRYNGAWGNAFGFRAALQARFNMQRNLYIYAEPRLALYAGTRFANDGFRRIRPDFSFNIGLGYRLLSKKERMAGATPFVGSSDGHLFFGVGGGLWSFARNRSHNYGFGSFFVGKYFSATAGLRVKGEFGRIDRISDSANRYLAIGSLDFVWNLNSAFGGYRPDQIFDLSLNVGPALAYADKAGAKFYPGAEAGLTALFRITPQWGIFIEPEVRLFTRKFYNDLHGGGFGPFLSVMAGVRYTLGNFKYNHAESYNDFLEAKNSFLTFAVAPAKRWKGNYGTGISGQVGFGKRFSPVSSWRVTADGDLFSASPNYLSLGLGVDYIFSLSTGMAGFNPDRLFDLSGLVGLTGGIGKYHGPVKGMVGGRIGLHGAFRLSEALDFYIEPQIAGNKLFGGTGWTPEFRLMLGLKYKLGTPTGHSTALADSFLSDGRNFVSLSAGPAFFSSTRRVGGSLDVAAGRWFSRVSGGRIGYNVDIVSTGRHNQRRPYLSTVHADYLLNITSLMDRDPGRRFHVIGIAGVGVGFSNLRHGRAGIVFEAGGQFRYNLPSDIDVHIEPLLTAYPNRMVPGYRSGSHFVAMARVMGGLSYRF